MGPLSAVAGSNRRGFEIDLEIDLSRVKKNCCLYSKVVFGL